jgi:hypothetical protein
MKFRITRDISSADAISVVYRVYEILGDDAICLRAGFGTEPEAREYVTRLINNKHEHETVIADIEG